MGCAVNGPGRRRGGYRVAGGRGEALLFSRGKIIQKLDEFDILPVMKRMIKEFQEEYTGKD
jgi:(E)-4-hydroxy-3-methylbut-2-enyl-diphosphate synthase